MSAARPGAAHFEVAETEAEMVRRIFRWVGEERVSLSAVCRRLFKAGVPSPTGKAQWGRSTVWTLLTSSASTGQAMFGKTASAPWRPPLRPARGRAPIPKRPSRRVPAPPEHHVTIPIPSLVSAALFEEMREQLDENRRRRRQRVARARYLLQGLLICQGCGRAFCGVWQRNYPRPPAHGYSYYRCTGAVKDRVDGQRRCDARAIRVERLDEAVWREVRQLLESPARVIGEYQRRLQAVRTGPRRPELETIERQLAKLRGGVGRLIDWALVEQQYDEIVRYTTAMAECTADPEALLRRFTRSNVQHPTCKALAELGKAVKTAFSPIA